MELSPSCPSTPVDSRVSPASHSSNSFVKRVCAWPAVRSMKPSTNAPARPSMEVENAVPMPSSGRARPAFNWLNNWFRSPEPTDMLPMTSATEPMVRSSPQKVPSRPRKISSPVM